MCFTSSELGGKKNIYFSAFSAEMGRSMGDIGNRFFKIMLPGFYEQKMKVPPRFCKKLKEEKSTRAILESSKGRFTVGVRRNRGDDEVVFEDGWPRFVSDHSLSAGDCLVFEHTQHLQFNVVVFGASACERHFLYHPNNHRQQCCRAHRQTCKKEAGVRHFSVKMRPYTATKSARVNIPLAFAKSINLEQKRRVTLRDSRKRSWTVSVYIQEAYGQRALMGRGWHDFYAANDLQSGDVCVFQLDPTSISSIPLFDVKVVRNADC